MSQKELVVNSSTIPPQSASSFFKEVGFTLEIIPKTVWTAPLKTQAVFVIGELQKDLESLLRAGLNQERNLILVLLFDSTR